MLCYGHTSRSLVKAKPRGFPDLPHGFRDFLPIAGEPLGFAPLLTEDLYWGPQHPDLATQRLLRTAHLRSDLRDDDEAIELAIWRLEEGDELVLWGAPLVSNCLSLLWALARLAERTDRLQQVSLVLNPCLPHQTYLSVEELLELWRTRVPVAEFLAPLLEARKHFASDSEAIEADVSALPPAVGEWVSLGNHLAELFPDPRGLDRFDDRLLEHLNADWQRAIRPVANSLLHLPDYLGPSAAQLWQRLIEFSNYEEFMSELGENNSGHRLCRLRFEGPARMTKARVTITGFGEEVRAGQADALAVRYIHRWAGGRLLTRGRLLRRSASYRQQYFVGPFDPRAKPACDEAQSPPDDL
jgi:hypothetical protein